MKTSEILPHFNGSIRELAESLRITREAVYQWGEDIPPLRVFQIRELLMQRGADVPRQESSEVV